METKLHLPTIEDFTSGTATEDSDVYESLTTPETKMRKLLEVFEEQSYKPPGGDPYISIAFQAIKENHQFLNLILQGQDKRRQLGNPLTYSHAANLGAIDAVNHIIRNEEDFLGLDEDQRNNYPLVPELNLHTIDGWVNLFRHIYSNYKDRLEELIVTRDIQTTHATRGIALPFIASNAFPEKSIKAVDLGSSAHIVWSNLAEGGDFSSIKTDQTEDMESSSLFLKAAKKPMNISQALGIDRKNPLFNEEDFNWLLSCRHYDQMTSSQIDKTTQTLLRYKTGLSNVRFLPGDIRARGLVTPGSQDIVTLFTVCYQYPMDVIMDILENALTMIDPEKGLIVLQDYCEVKQNGSGPAVVFTDSREFWKYSTIVYGPGTNFEPLQIAKYKNSNCKEIKSGPDLLKFKQLCQAKNGNMV